ncbi:unnamed protein product [Owenia fusiformis]|uniref:EF-hand domain-containing protein n=1 Tax=Owenia fusiformis TaxID=6347 RepID=A0A8S4PNW6_OWEFU|nr:unnamed protein product [Owenia fusiformis]
MKVAVIFLTLAFVATMQLSDAWRIRLPRLGLRRIIAPICNQICNVKCTVPGICAPVCNKVCNIGRKRRAVANDDGEKPFSADYYKYDMNNDDIITLSEFAIAISSTPAKCVEIFGMADLNDDGVLDMSEFLRGPFQFGGKMEDYISQESSEESDEFEDSEEITTTQKATFTQDITTQETLTTKQ